jgi:hypothetical protein
MASDIEHCCFISHRARSAPHARCARRVLGAFAVVAATALVACATETSVTQLWSAPIPVNQPPMRRIVVMATQMDEANRRVLEDALTAELAKHGVQGTQSYTLFADQLPERERAKQLMRDVGADGILTANFKGIRERLTYEPGYYTGDFWGGYYGGVYRGSLGGYVYTDQIVNVETALWDARANDQTVWAVLTQTTNPSSGPDFVRSVTKKVVAALAAAHWIAPGTTED